MAKRTAADIMTTDPTTLHARHQLARVAEEFHLGRIRHLPIVDAHDHLIGLVTQQDLLCAGEDLARPISEVMQTDLKTVNPDTPAHEVAYLLLHYDVGCAPVVDRDGKLVGIVTDTDFVRIAYVALGGAVPVEQLEDEVHEAENL